MIANSLTSFFLLAAVVLTGAVTIVARGPAGLRIEGTSAEVSVDEEASALIFKVPIPPIDTGIALRNRHLREALDVDRFPVALLRVRRADLNVPTAAAPTEGTATGELTLHGQSHPVTVHYRAQHGDDGVTRLHGSLRIDLREFGVKLPSYLGVAVAPEVDIEVELTAILG